MNFILSSPHCQLGQTKEKVYKKMQEKSIKNRIEIHFPIFISKNERFQMSFYIHLCWRKPCFDSSLVAICRDLIQSSLNVFVSFIDRDSDGLWRNIIYCFMLVFCVGRTIVIVCCVHPFLSHSLSFSWISQLIRARNDRKCCLLVVADIHCSVCFILVVSKIHKRTSSEQQW